MSKNYLYYWLFPYGKSEVWAINELNSLQDLDNEITIIPRSGKGEIINQDAIKFNSHLIDLPFINFPILISLLKNILFKPSIFLNFYLRISGNQIRL